MQPAELFTMQMLEPDRPPLTAEEKREKERLRDLVKSRSAAWEQEHPNEGKLTQAKLGALVGELRGQEPMTQGAIWHYISPKSDTKLNPGIVQAIAFLLGFDVAEVSERFRPKRYEMPPAETIDSAIMNEISRLPLAAKKQFLAQIAAVADSMLE